MNKLTLTKLIPVLFIILFLSGSCSQHLFHRNPEKAIFGKTHRGKRDVNVKEPRKVLRAKKKQEANQRKLDKDWARSVKRSQKRTIEIQTPEVKERMRQNEKELKSRDIQKKKKAESGTKRAARKYR